MQAAHHGTRLCGRAARLPAAQRCHGGVEQVPVQEDVRGFMGEGRAPPAQLPGTRRILFGRFGQGAADRDRRAVAGVEPGEPEYSFRELRVLIELSLEVAFDEPLQVGDRIIRRWHQASTA